MARPYVRAVSPQLRKVLLVVWALVMVLGANSAYLASITFAEWVTGRTFQNYFYLWMFIGHLAVGLLLLVPFLVFAVFHVRAAWRRRNRRAVRVGYVLLASAVALLASGVLLTRFPGIHADATRRAHGNLLGARAHAHRRSVALHPASPRRAAHQMAAGVRVAWGRRRAHRHGHRDAPAEPSTLECRGAEGAAIAISCRRLHERRPAGSFRPGR